ncbi:MAG: bifunctional riboflavin kinase/FAD synthetase [Gammaproteobacteria bacterium]|nr:bifunctional riboflavin kinase/FAD synthetase [Gammaproteobacteria bacterium]MDH5499623.1 bifunctional riboflavin kinase/FAD synthetase [Gammaproteobacteria bacterium]
MYLVRTAASFPFDLVRQGSVATIGAYDGLHLGHQQLLQTVRDRAKKHGLPTVVMSFEPMPREYFATSSPPARLMRFREKFDALDSAGIDIFYCPRFGSSMRQIDANTFIRRILIHAMNVRDLVVGNDFRFAANREGSIEHLRRAGRALGFDIQQVPSVISGGERVSSTAVRNALADGDLAHAGRLLGKPYSMSGKVIKGERVGRKLGFPTANVNLRRRQSPVMGIFAARVHGLGGQALDAVASVGTRPTFDGTKPILEVHIFDFDRDIYGKYIHVEFVERLRDERRFSNAEALVEQMHRDSQQARAVLAA